MRRPRRYVLITLGVVLLALGAACVALQRPDIPWAKLDAKYANTESRFMDLPGGLRIHYRNQGLASGPSVVLVHGFSASLHAWEPWVRLIGILTHKFGSIAWVTTRRVTRS